MKFVDDDDDLPKISLTPSFHYLSYATLRGQLSNGWALVNFYSGFC